MFDIFHTNPIMDANTPINPYDITSEITVKVSDEDDEKFNKCLDKLLTSDYLRIIYGFFTTLVITIVTIALI